MNACAQLEALNPVPELRGNPGRWNAPGESGYTSPKATRVLGLVALSLLLVGAASFGVRLRSDRAQQIEVASDHSSASSPVVGAQPAALAAVARQDTPAEPIGDEGIARITIADIDLDLIVVEGVGVNELQKGPGHYPESAFPGEPGNAAIAGHRTTYGAPFMRLNEVEVDDSILINTIQGSFEYRVVESKIVDPSATHVLQDVGDHRLTLTSEHPPYSNRERIVIVAKLVNEPAPKGQAQLFGISASAPAPTHRHPGPH